MEKAMLGVYVEELFLPAVVSQQDRVRIDVPMPRRRTNKIIIRKFEGK